MTAENTRTDCADDLHCVELRIPNRLEALADVKAAWDGLVARQRIGAELATDMRIALDEVLSNLIHYAFPEHGTHAISVRLCAGATRMEACVVDDGVAFDPLAAPEPVLDAPVEAWPIGGLGIHLVRQLMTEVSYERRANQNHLRMVRVIDA